MDRLIYKYLVLIRYLTHEPRHWALHSRYFVVFLTHRSEQLCWKVTPTLILSCCFVWNDSSKNAIILVHICMDMHSISTANFVGTLILGEINIAKIYQNIRWYWKLTRSCLYKIRFRFLPSLFLHPVENDASLLLEEFKTLKKQKKPVMVYEAIFQRDSTIFPRKTKACRISATSDKSQDEMQWSEKYSNHGSDPSSARFPRLWFKSADQFKTTQNLSDV